MAKILVLQHHPSEHLGKIAEALEASAQAWQYVRTYEGQPVPRDIRGAAGLILMGGPMGVYETERYPFLSDEMALIESALKDNKPVLGTCLGSQLLASVLGARVTKGERAEIGWHQVTLTGQARSDRLLRGVPEAFTPCHWHGDVFDPPEGAVTLASSAMTRCQGFRWGANAYGFLFHMEITEEIVRNLSTEFARQLDREGIDAGALLAATPGRIEALEPIASIVFGRWADLSGAG